MSFKEQMRESERRKGSNIVLALDIVSERNVELLNKSFKILEETQPFICALKMNRHLVLPLGLFDGVKALVERAHASGLPVVMDCKINDIGNTNRVIAKNYFEAGFDAVTANPFVGWEEGLQPVFSVAKRTGRGVILLVYMSHKAAWEGYGQPVYDSHAKQPKQQYQIFAEKALSWQADGAVVGATYPDKIKEVYAILKEEVPIYAPGVGAQGGSVEAAAASGARYLIVGRSIIETDEPADAAKRMRDIASRSQKRL